MTLPDTLTIALALAAPFGAAMLAPALSRAAGRAAGWLLAIVPLAIFLALLRLLPQIAGGASLKLRADWVPAYDLALSFEVDGLSLTFALAISGIGALIVAYSGAYLAGHAHRGRFLAFLMAFMGAMLGLVLADATPLLFAFWELTSLTSFLLIGFDHRRQAARRAAIQAIVLTTGIGGLGLLVAAVLMHQFGGSWDLSVLRSRGTLYGTPGFLLVLVPTLLAAFTKSAQVPFHFWLPNAMEAPTPVSAFLHSATMVQAGIYLLARMTPILGGNPVWTGVLVLFGGVTMLWGAVLALRQTDLKQMLAQTTIAALGLLVLLLGLGSEAAIAAAIIYFVTHALYKAGLFLVAGTLDHETGTLDITALGGLRDAMPASFIAAAMAAISMLGLPPAIGYLAKEAMYGQLAPLSLPGIVLALVLVIGNGLVGAIGLAVALKPFLGETLPTPKAPHEGAIGLLAGPLVMGGAGLAVIFAIAGFARLIVVPAAAAVLGRPVAPHVEMGFDPRHFAFWLSLATWALAVAAYWRLAAIRTVLRRLQATLGASLDRGFDVVMFGLIRLAARVTHAWHHGRLELYVTVLFVMLAIAVLAPFVAGWRWPAFAMPALRPTEWGVLLLGVLGVGAVLLAPSRLISILALGVQGLATALLFLIFGAPDLAFTQLMVEILTVVVLALVMGRLTLDIRDRRPREDLLRDGVLSVLAGGGIALALAMVLSLPFDDKLGAFFTAMSVAHGHGHNIVNVILVDFRGLDTLGEISVVMGAGIAIMALLRRRPAPPRDAASAGAGKGEDKA